MLGVGMEWQAFLNDGVFRKGRRFLLFQAPQLRLLTFVPSPRLYAISFCVHVSAFPDHPLYL